MYNPDSMECANCLVVILRDRTTNYNPIGIVQTALEYLNPDEILSIVQEHRPGEKERIEKILDLISVLEDDKISDEKLRCLMRNILEYSSSHEIIDLIQAYRPDATKRAEKIIEEQTVGSVM